MKGDFYETSDIMKLLCCRSTKASQLMVEWKNELIEQGYFPGVKGLISKEYVNEKLYGKKKFTIPKKAMSV